jgi:propanediol utilization protein
MEIKVGVSARHVHLTQRDLNILFGEGYNLTKYKDLVQSGQFASNEVITIKTDKGSFDNVRILGPVRSYTQVEISKTDAYILGINPPIRSAGDLSNSETVTLIGPKGELIAYNSCIIADRHIHANKEDLEKYNLRAEEIVKIKVGGEKAGIMENVIVKAADSFRFELHIDLDDANAHLIKTGDIIEIVRDENE